MKVFVVCLCIIVLLLVLYLFSLRGRRYNYQKKSFLHIRYTHRGLFKRGFIPENSLSAFKNAVIKGFGIELDVHLLADGSLAVIHDHSLERTTGQKGTVEELTAADLSKYKLVYYQRNSKPWKGFLEFSDAKIYVHEDVIEELGLEIHKSQESYARISLMEN